jgi:hypothetical protein
MLATRNDQLLHPNYNLAKLERSMRCLKCNLRLARMIAKMTARSKRYKSH